MSGRRITRIIGASLIALAILPILVTAIQSGMIIQRSIRENIRNSLASITNAAAIEAERSLRPAWRILEALTFYLATDPSLEDLHHFIEANQRARTEIEVLALLDVSGRVISISASTEADRLTDYSGMPEFATARTSTGFTFSRPYVSPLDGRVTVAVYRKTGPYVGLVLLDLEDIANFLDRLRLSPADHVAVIDEAGRFIAHTDMAFVREQRYARDIPATGQMNTTTHDGRNYYGMSVDIRGTGWKVLYHRDRNDARKMLGSFLSGLIGVAVLALLAAVAAAIRIGRALTAPFARITEETQALAEGRYDRRIIGDWPLELETIARAINTMAENIERRDRDLQQSEERYRALFFGTKVPALLIDPKSGRIRDANHAAVTYYGYGREELTGKPIWEINCLSEEELRLRMEETITAVGRGMHYRFRHRLKCGELRDVEVFSTPLDITEETFIHSTIFDVTDWVRAEAQVRRDLEEKTVLLKEVHHRVKNNLQIVASLLHLQSGRIRDPADAELFQASQDRVHSMALTHEILYQSPDLSSVDMREYANRLLEYIRDAYPLPGLEIEADIRPFTLPLERALPCGLVINELVTNALKHAIPRAAEPWLSIRLSADGAALLEVEDSGPGLPPDFDPARVESLGMSLIESLTRQLEGELRWEARCPGETCPGLRIRLRFPLA